MTAPTELDRAAEKHASDAFDKEESPVQWENAQTDFKAGAAWREKVGTDPGLEPLVRPTGASSGEISAESLLKMKQGDWLQACREIDSLKSERARLLAVVAIARKLAEGYRRMNLTRDDGTVAKCHCELCAALEALDAASGVGE